MDGTREAIRFPIEMDGRRGQNPRGICQRTWKPLEGDLFQNWKQQNWPKRKCFAGKFLVNYSPETQCRIRYDKLKRLDKRSSSSTPGAVSTVHTHEILPIAGPSRSNLSREVDQQMATIPENIGVETLVFIPSVPNAVSKPRPKPKARAKGKKKAPAPDDSPTLHDSLETVDSQEGSKTGGPVTLRKSTMAVTDDINTNSGSTTQEIVGGGTAPRSTRRRNKMDPSLDDATDTSATITAPKGQPKARPKLKKGVTNATLESTPSTTGKKRKANDMEPPTAPAPKKVRVTNSTAETNVTSREVPASSSMVIDAKPAQPQLRRGRSRKIAEPGPVESVHADAAVGATTTVKRGRGPGKLKITR